MRRDVYILVLETIKEIDSNCNDTLLAIKYGNANKFHHMRLMKDYRAYRNNYRVYELIRDNIPEECREKCDAMLKNQLSVMVKLTVYFNSNTLNVAA